MTPLDLVIRGGRVIDPARDVDRTLRCRHPRRPNRRAVAQDRRPASTPPGRAGPPRAPGHDRHPRARVSARDRRLRDEPRRGRRSLGRDHDRRSGRRRSADLPGVPQVHRGAGPHARVRLHLQLPGRRPVGPSLRRSLRTARDQRERDGADDRRKSGHRQGHQVPRRGWRVLPLGHRNAQAGQAGVTGNRGAGICPPGAALGGRGRHADRSRRRLARRAAAARSRRHPGASVHEASRAPSSRRTARCTP